MSLHVTGIRYKILCRSNTPEKQENPGHTVVLRRKKFGILGIGFTILSHDFAPPTKRIESLLIFLGDR